MPDTPTLSSPLTPLAKRPRADSIGEELYLVHLQRMAAPDPHPEDAEDDHDRESPRKLQKTIGEELFEVHLERSRGLPPDYDVVPDTKGSDRREATKTEITESESKAHDDTGAPEDKPGE